MNQSDRFGLAFIEAGQAQKEVTHNAVVQAIDGLLHLAVLSRTATTPPASPAAGAMWIVADGATGAWAARDRAIAAWDGFGWSFRVAVTGMLAWVADQAVFSVWRGGNWSAGGWPASGLDIGGRAVLAAPPALIAAPAGGTTIDAEARAAIVALAAALRSQGVIA